MRCDTTRRALLSRLFHLGRDSLSKLRKSITIFLARVSYHTIYGASWLQRTYIPPSSLLLSFFLSLLYPAAMLCEVNAQYNLGTYKNGISKRAFRSCESLARECLVVPKIADDEFAHLHAPLSPHRFRYVVPSSSRRTRCIRNATYYFERGLSEDG